MIVFNKQNTNQNFDDSFKTSQISNISKIANIRSVCVPILDGWSI